MELIARTWNLSPRQIQYGGMKDKHAVTKQTLTIRGGPKEDLKRATVDLTYVGSAARPFGPAHILGNRFTAVLRRIEGSAEPAIRAALAEVARDHVPNYFDDQRFRSLGPSGSSWRAPGAMPTMSGRSGSRSPRRTPRTRPTTRSRSGRSAMVGEVGRREGALTRSHRRSIVTYLADHPQDFRGAFERVRVELRRIYLAAFQSYLWNRVLAEIVIEATPPLTSS